METTVIKITEYCKHYQIEQSFIIQLKEEGMLSAASSLEQGFISSEDIPSLDMFRRWHYDLGINLEGIDAMRHMIQKIQTLQDELNTLQLQLNLLNDKQG